MRRLLGVLLILPLAAPAAAQMVTEVRATDTLLIENVGEVKLLGVEGLGSPTAGAKEWRCAASAKLPVFQLAHAKEVRLFKDAKVANRPELASHYYVYLPDGRLLNQLVLETGCARPRLYVGDLTFATPLQNAVTHAQMANRGLYGLDDVARPSLPTRPEQIFPRPAAQIFPTPPSQIYRRVTLSAFNRIRIGASYSDIVSIFGTHGKEVRSTETARFKRTVFKWAEDDGPGFASIEFRNGLVESKSHVGLQ